MAFLIEYVATLAKLLMAIGGFLFEATRQGTGFIFGVSDIAYICVVVLIISTILESHRFQAMSREDGIKHSASAWDASRLDESLRHIMEFSCANHVSVRTAT